MRELKPICSKTLAKNLARLTDNKIIEKTIERESPPHTQYTLTAKGLDLLDALQAMIEWGKKW